MIPVYSALCGQFPELKFVRAKAGGAAAVAD